ncbi:hypothetical protein PBI_MALAGASYROSE_44 [Mycobacterium phage MalagasyRose]|uniref:Immunity repressor n=1 Tax=Mycobacterium phage MalagasyRose TaxID=2599870 RepID=A0A5J6TJ81_9CAUD|nr:hypothetical protein QEH39_gp44 [Mycobacterium phage MalagasyRose]QFG08892.1 hypothetical protein PBI_MALAGASYROSE_44 [Mycobacterium phage MalagasyRose]
MRELSQTCVAGVVNALVATSQGRCATIRFETRIADMPRTDRNGKELQESLAYWLDVTKQELQRAYTQGFGCSNATYFRHRQEDNYPDAEQIRVIANELGYDETIRRNLEVEFGLAEPDDDHKGLAQGGTTTAPFATATRRKVEPKQATKAQIAKRNPPL